MNRRLLWSIVLLAPVVLIFGVIADRAIVNQARIAAIASRSEANQIARLAALSVQATISRLEAAVLAEEPQDSVRVFRVLLASRRPFFNRVQRAYRTRNFAELDELSRSSTAITSQGFPEAVVAAIARGTTSARHAAAARLLAGELPVHPDDLPYLGPALDIAEPELQVLQRDLRAVLNASLPAVPEFRRTLTDGGSVQGWSRRGDHGVGYEISVEALLDKAEVPDDVTPTGLPPGRSEQRIITVTVPDVDGLAIGISPQLPGQQPTLMLRTILWLAVALSLAGVAVVIRAVSRERAAVVRERAFLATVSHELRTPVAALRLLGETLARGRGSSREYGELVAQDSERLEALVERVLATTRMDQAPCFAVVEPAGIVSSAVRMVSGRARKRGVSIDWQPPEAASPEALWDGEAVLQALLNLLDNAIKHGRRNGHVEVTIERGGASLALTVADDGPGIARRDRGRVFERFGRSETDGVGVGLGLYVVEQVAAAHGGRVDLRTAPNEGCAFALVLPLAPPGASSARVPAGAST